MRLTTRLKTRLDTRLPVRLSSAIAIQTVSRYFRRNEGTTDYATIPTVTLSGDFAIEFDVLVSDFGGVRAFLGDVLSSATSYVGITENTGHPLIKIGGVAQTYEALTFALNEMNKIKITRIGGVSKVTLNGVSQSKSASPIPDSFSQLFGTGGARFLMKGILSNLKVWDNGALIRHYPLDDNSDTLVDKVNGQNGTVINGNPDDWGLFDRQANGDWLGQELWGLPNTAATWSNFSSAATDIPDGVLITSLDGNYDRGEAIVDNPPLHVGSNYSVSVLARRGAQGVAQHVDQFTFMSIPPTPITSSVMTKYEFNGICTNSTGVMRVYANTDGLIGDEVVIGGVSIKEVLKNA